MASMTRTIQRHMYYGQGMHYLRYKKSLKRNYEERTYEKPKLKKRWWHNILDLVKSWFK